MRRTAPYKAPWIASLGVGVGFSLITHVLLDGGLLAPTLPFKGAGIASLGVGVGFDSPYQDAAVGRFRCKGGVTLYVPSLSHRRSGIRVSSSHCVTSSGLLKTSALVPGIDSVWPPFLAFRVSDT